MTDVPSTGETRAAGTPYRVLARKYRPQTFDELIGQDAMVRTLTNAFDTGRIAQAYMLTGVRGVGKTTTARIIARALNYSLPGKADAPTVHMDEPGEHCQAIMESRHVDVVELDAASHTGIDDIREIIESARYRPVSARTKVYIIDEVHMLSKQAFNGLLKTLEEPPEHVKFIFATTEIRKVPITVLSRCQRFDLRRIDSGVLAAFLRDILAKEKVEADEEALALIARAAEGSARDALSILDQAIAHAAGRVAAEEVRDMLGLADRARVIELFTAVMAGDVAGALKELKAQYDAGADPAVVLSDLAALTHFITRVKYVPEAAGDPSLAEGERRAAQDFAEKLDARVLARSWQMLLKGLGECQTAPRPLAAAEMVLVRLAHAAGLPTPDELIRALGDGGDGTQAARPATPARQPAGATAKARNAPPLSRGPGGGARMGGGDVRPVMAARPDSDALPEEGTPIACLADIVALAAAERDLPLKIALEERVRLVRLEPGRLEIDIDEGAPADLANRLSGLLKLWTGARWMVVVASGRGGPTLAEEARAKREARFAEAAADPVVRRLLDRFPGAEIVDVRDKPVAGDGAPGDFADEPDEPDEPDDFDD
ncbi:MAG: DNA polymerase III subunit gamma/tau [Hyphomicrobiales bacterium]|nr:DNA polymerase III subunit gamma/tau [Hyphomicrobiales bacterium]